MTDAGARDAARLALTNAIYFGAADAQAAAFEFGRFASRPRRSRRAEERWQQRWRIRQEGSGAGRDAAGGGGGRGGRGGTWPAPAAAQGRGAAPDTTGCATLWGTTAALSGVMNALQAADVSPTANTVTALTAAQAGAAGVMARWRALRTVDLAALNLKLKAAGAPALALK